MKLGKAHRYYRRLRTERKRQGTGFNVNIKHLKSKITNWLEERKLMS